MLPFLSTSFKKVDENKWFFKLVDLLNPLQKNSIIEKYFSNTLNDSVELVIKMSHKNYERRDGEG